MRLGQGRNEVTRVQIETDEVGQVQFEAVEAGGGEHDGVVVAFAKSVNAGGHIATQSLDLEVRPKQKELVPAADGGCADGGALSEGKPRPVLPRIPPDEQHVLCGGPNGHGGNGQAVGLSGLEVLVAVDGKVHGVVEQGLFDFLGEETLAFEFLERLDLFPVPLRGENLDVASAATGFDEVPDVAGLPPGEVTAACSDPEVGSVDHGQPWSSWSMTTSLASFMGREMYFFSR